MFDEGLVTAQGHGDVVLAGEGVGPVLTAAGHGVDPGAGGGPGRGDEGGGADAGGAQDPPVDRFRVGHRGVSGWKAGRAALWERPQDSTRHRRAEHDGDELRWCLRERREAIGNEVHARLRGAPYQAACRQGVRGGDGGDRAGGHRDSARRGGAGGAGRAARRPDGLRRAPVGDHRRREARRLARGHGRVQAAGEHGCLRLHRSVGHRSGCQHRLQPELPRRLQRRGAKDLRRHGAPGRPGADGLAQRARHRRGRDQPGRPSARAALLLQPGAARRRLLRSRQSRRVPRAPGRREVRRECRHPGRVRAPRRRQRVRVGPDRPWRIGRRAGRAAAGADPVLRRGRRRQRRARGHLGLDRVDAQPRQAPAAQRGPARPGGRAAGHAAGGRPGRRGPAGGGAVRGLAGRQAGPGRHHQRAGLGPPAAAPGVVHGAAEHQRLPGPRRGRRHRQRRGLGGERHAAGPGLPLPRRRRRGPRRRRQRRASLRDDPAVAGGDQLRRHRAAGARHVRESMSS